MLSPALPPSSPVAKSSQPTPGRHVSPALLKRVQALWRPPGDAPEVLLEGPHLLYEALDSGTAVSAVWYTAEAAGREGLKLSRALQRARHLGASAESVGERTLATLSPTRTPSGVLAIAARPAHVLSALLSPDGDALLVIGADIQDPGNAGAMVRVTEAAGGTGVWFTKESADPFSWRSLRGSMGSGLRLPVVRAGTAQAAMAACAARGVQVVATDDRASLAMYDVDYRCPTAFLLGNEGSGLPKALVRAASAVVAIPMAPTVNSLNVATAAAILMYEARRQRTHSRRP